MSVPVVTWDISNIIFVYMIGRKCPVRAVYRLFSLWCRRGARPTFASNARGVVSTPHVKSKTPQRKAVHEIEMQPKKKMRKRPDLLGLRVHEEKNASCEEIRLTGEGLASSFTTLIVHNDGV